MPNKLLKMSLLVATVALTFGGITPANSATTSAIDYASESYFLEGDTIPTLDMNSTTVDLDNEGQEIPVEDLAPRPEGMGKYGYLLEGDEYPTLDLGGGMVELPVDKIDMIAPYIAGVSCGSRLDWYRLVTLSGKVHCYRNAGKTATLQIPGVWSVCPGANYGRAQYRFPRDNKTYWTKYQGPLAASNHTRCFPMDSTGAGYKVERVQIG